MGYFIFIFAALTLLLIGELTRREAFKKLYIKRSVDKQYVNPGEEFRVTTTLENRKWMPVSFLFVEEELPSVIQRKTQEAYDMKGSYTSYKSSYSIQWFERIRRSYAAVIDKRGVYAMKNFEVSIGDVFGFTFERKNFEDYTEIVVFPELKPIKDMNMENKNLQGESIIKRWIYKDPLYIKGIREYNIEDRMKDIHWKSSLRMNKLMVKDYDYTSDRELVFIVNVQCGDPFWSYVDKTLIERGIEAAAAFAAQAVKEGVPVGMWTNAQIISYSSDFKSEVMPSLNSLRSIMELCARVDYNCRTSFDEYLTGKISRFNKNTVYVFVTPFLNDECISLLINLKRNGYLAKLIDTSENSTLPYVEGIEKITYNGGVRV